MNYKKIIIIMLILSCITGCGKFKEYKTSFKAFNETINITLYTTNVKKGNQAIDDIKKIYKDSKKILKEVQNIDENKSISNKLKDLITYKININNKSKSFIKFDDIKIKNNKLNSKNIYLEPYIKGYTINKVYEYLKEKGISKFFINSNSQVLAGDTYSKKYYTVALVSPFNNKIMKMQKVKNQYVITKSIYDSFYKNEYFQDASIKAKNDNVSVTVITDDILTGDMLSTVLFLLPIEKGKQVIKNYNVKAIWCYKINGQEKIEYTDNIDEY